MTAFDIIFLAALIMVPVALVFALAHRSGWRELARAYPVPRSFSSNRAIRFASARVGSTMLGGINNGLTIAVGEQGLRFSVIIVGFAYPPFFVPWEDISLGELKQRHVDLRFRQAPQVPLRISARTYDCIMRMAARTIGSDHVAES